MKKVFLKPGDTFVAHVPVTVQVIGNHLDVPVKVEWDQILKLKRREAHIGAFQVGNDHHPVFIDVVSFGLWYDSDDKL